MNAYFNDKNVFHKGKGRNVLHIGGKVLVVGGLQRWRLRRGEGLPCARHSRFQLASQQIHYRRQLSPSAILVAALGKHDRVKHCMAVGVRKKHVRHNFVNTKVIEEGGGGGAPGTGAEILLQLMETMVEQVFSAACGGDHSE